MKPTVIAVGNLTKDVVFERTKTNGVPCAKFTVACNSGRKDDRATFLWCVAYNQAAESIAKFFRKGQAIQIVGDLSQYEDEKKQAHTYCDVRQWGFVGAKSTREPPPPTDENRRTPEQMRGEDTAEDTAESGGGYTDGDEPF